MTRPLTPHFSLEELIFSDLAARRGIDNSPGPAALANLCRLAETLEAVRAILDAPIHINSGFRCEMLNHAVGGQPNSAHLEGRAADIIAPQFGPPLAICKALIESGGQFDQLILEYGRWVHIAIPKAGQPPRRQVLTIDQTGTRVGLS